MTDRLLREGPCWAESGSLLRWADQVVPMSSMDGNDTLLRSAAGAGNGIAALPEAMLREDIATGNVVPVLNDCSTTDGDLELCRFYAHRQLLPALQKFH